MDQFPDVFLRLVVCILLASNIRATYAREYYWTIKVKAGQRDCYFQHMDLREEAEIEYQVLEGGELDIDVFFISPTGKSLVADKRRSEGVHTISATEKGDHQLCIDNSFSTMTDKLVFLDLSMTQDNDDEWKDTQLSEKDDGTDEEISSMQNTAEKMMKTRAAKEAKTTQLLNEQVSKKCLEEKFLQKSLTRVHEHLTEIIDIQSHLRARESRHRHTADSNNERVFHWSLLECGVLVAVGGLQVFMLRRLFGSHSKTTA